MDAILLKLDLQKRTKVLGNPPNEKLFVYKKCSTYQEIGDVLFKSGVGFLFLSVLTDAILLNLDLQKRPM